MNAQNLPAVNRGLGETESTRFIMIRGFDKSGYLGFIERPRKLVSILSMTVSVEAAYQDISIIFAIVSKLSNNLPHKVQHELINRG